MSKEKKRAVIRRSRGFRRAKRQTLPLFLKQSAGFSGGQQNNSALLLLLENTFFIPRNTLFTRLVLYFVLLNFSRRLLPLKILTRLSANNPASGKLLLFFDRLRVLKYIKNWGRAFFLKNRRATIKFRKTQNKRLYFLRRFTLRLNKLRLGKPKFGYYALRKYYKKLSNLEGKLASLKSHLINSGWSNKHFRRESQPPLNLFRRLVGQSLRRGNKKKVIKLLLNELCRLRRVLKIRRPTLFFLGVIIKKLNPFFVMRKHSVGRRTFTIPFPLINKKKIAVISRLFLRALTRRTEISFRRRLSEELKDIFIRGRRPASLKLKKDILRSAFENKPNIRFLNIRRRNY